MINSYLLFIQKSGAKFKLTTRFLRWIDLIFCLFQFVLFCVTCGSFETKLWCRFMLFNSCVKVNFYSPAKYSWFLNNSTRLTLNHIDGPKVAINYETLIKEYFRLCELRDNHSCNVQRSMQRYMAVFRAEWCAPNEELVPKLCTAVFRPHTCIWN